MSDLYFNEWEPFAAQWLRNLFPEAVVDERSISDIDPAEPVRAVRQHYFGGIGGWEYALNLAGWGDREVWTASLPCQPFSAAGKQEAEEDERHLWPVFLRHVQARRPVTIFGEQVPAAIGIGWLDRVQADLAAEGYTFGFTVLGAHSVSSPHIRQRVFWVARGVFHAASNGRQSRGAESEGRGVAGGCGIDAARPGRLGSPSRPGLARRQSEQGDDGSQRPPAQRASGKSGRVAIPRRSERRGIAEQPGEGDGEALAGPSVESGRSGDIGGLGYADGRLRGDGNIQPGWEQRLQPEGGGDSPWYDYLLIPCRDDKVRRTGRLVQPLAHGIPSRSRDVRMEYLLSRLVELGHSAKAARRLLREARRNRIGRLKGAGNAIVPQVAATFIRAYMQTLEDSCQISPT